MIGYSGPKLRRLWVLSVPFAAIGCVEERSILAPAGSAARHLSDLGAPILVGFTLTSVVMWLLLGWVAYRRTGSLDVHDSPDAGGGQLWIIIGGLAVPVVTFATVFAMTLRTMAEFPMHHEASPEIKVIGRQWWWEADYLGGDLPDHFVTANEIHIPAGRPVDIELQSEDVVHSFWVPRLHGKVDLVPGQTNHIRIEADREGVYPGVCAELCGMQHTNMRFLVIADSASNYAAWLAAQRLPAAAPSSDEARRGEGVFTQHACVLCHSVRGTAVRSRVGPDLTHLGSRRTLGAASFTNDSATLHAWVTNAPSLKPGVRMPELTQFTGPELHDLVAYLQELK